MSKIDKVLHDRYFSKQSGNDTLTVIRLFRVADKRELTQAEQIRLWTHSAPLWINMLPETRHRIINLCDDVEKPLR